MTSTSLHRRELLTLAGAGTALAAQTAMAQDGPSALGLPPAAYHLGIVTYNIAATWDVPTILRICKSVGLKAVELRTTHKHGVEPTLTADQRAEVRSRFKEGDIQLWGLGTVCEFHSKDADEVKKHIETCKQFLQLASDLGAKGVKVRPNGLPKEVPVEKTLEKIGKALAQCGQAAADLGQEVWLEVHGAGTSHPPHIKTIMETCNHSSVGITWNSNKTDLKDGSVRPYFEMLRPWLKACHINELYSTYPYQQLFTLLREAKYDRVTLVEIPQKLEPAAGELLLRYYKRLWEEWTGGSRST
jgi:sugar phosphate isomerase/epimerase